MAAMKVYFDSLDLDSSGAICVDELKVPLIGLGLVDSVEEVENLLRLVDIDQSGEIEFNEFVRVILDKVE